MIKAVLLPATSSKQKKKQALIIAPTASCHQFTGSTPFKFALWSFST